jgi:hypothetical protein
MRGAPGVGVKVEAGSATSWDRPADQAWLIRLHRGRQSVIVAWGLHREAAERLAARIADLLGGAGPACCSRPRPRPRRGTGQP